MFLSCNFALMASILTFPVMAVGPPRALEKGLLAFTLDRKSVV